MRKFTEEELNSFNKNADALIRSGIIFEDGKVLRCLEATKDYVFIGKVEHDLQVMEVQMAMRRVFVGKRYRWNSFTRTYGIIDEVVVMSPEEVERSLTALSLKCGGLKVYR